MRQPNNLKSDYHLKKAVAEMYPELSNDDPTGSVSPLMPTKSTKISRPLTKPDPPIKSTADKDGKLPKAVKERFIKLHGLLVLVLAI